MYSLTGIGIPYYDCIIPVPEAVLTTHHLPKGQTGTLDHKLCQQLAARYGCTYRMGGPAANTLAGFAALGGTVGGNQAPCAHFGVLANDAAGTATKHNLAARGIAHLHHSDRPHLSSPVIYALVTPDGERTFIAFKNSAEDILPHEVPATLASATQALFTQIRFIIRGGLLPLFAPHFATAKQAQKTVAFSLQAFVNNAIADEIRAAVATHATMVFANQTEIMAFTRTTTLADALAALTATDAHSPTPILYVITRGAAGAVLHQNGGSTFFNAAPVPHIVDAIGAGDQFAAGFLYRFLQARPEPGNMPADRPAHMAACVALGQSCAAAILQIQGGQPPLDANWQALVKAAA